MPEVLITPECGVGAASGGAESRRQLSNHDDGSLTCSFCSETTIQRQKIISHTYNRHLPDVFLRAKKVEIRKYAHSFRPSNELQKSCPGFRRDGHSCRSVGNLGKRHVPVRARSNWRS